MSSYAYRLFAIVFLLGCPFVLCAQNVQSVAALRKISPALASAKRSSFKQLRILVEDTSGFQNWARRSMPGLHIQQAQSNKHTFTVSHFSRREFNQLLSSPWIMFIDVPNRKPKDELELDKADFTVNKITPLSTYAPQFAGEGIVVSVKERPFDKEDIDFKGRIIEKQVRNEPFSTHATTIATLIAGGGNSAPSGKGVAWKSQLITSSYQELLPDDGMSLIANNISVQNHSYGVDIENYYGIEALTYDQHCSQFPELLHIFSSGNSGNETSTTGIYAGIAGAANLTGQFKQSKNTLSVGASDLQRQVVPLSSRGPAYDGRIKPEIIAYGEGGTSESAALVSGTCALLQQAFRIQHTNKLPPASLVKAILLNSADDTGRPGPDFESGFGNLDALGAVKTIQDKRYFTETLGSQESETFQITVPPGANELKLTLAWHDPEAAINAQTALVNDLDLELTHTTTGERWKPWVLNTYPHPDSLLLPATREADHLNNAEQITVSLPKPGTYQVIIKGYAVPTGSQLFSVAYEYTTMGLTWTFPVKESNLTAHKEYTLRWEWHGPEINAVLEYQLAGQTGWQIIDDNIVLSDQQIRFSTPAVNALAQMRLRVQNSNRVYTSDQFYITQPLTLSVGFACEEVLLTWPQAEGIAKYQLYSLGEKYLEPFIQTSDTLVVLSKQQKEATYFAIAPLIKDKPAGVSYSTNYLQAGINCYIKSFLPRQLVTDTVLLDLEIGSLYDIHSISLERQHQGTYQTIQTISPVTQLVVLLSDANPVSSRNVYRIKIENSRKEYFYSQPEEVFYIQEGELLLYPNPVGEGQIMNILAAETEPATIRIYTITGKMITEYVEISEIKTLRINGLQPGNYIIQLQTARGKNLSGKIIVY